MLKTRTEQNGAVLKGGTSMEEYSFKESAAWLIEKREEKGISRRKLASLSGVSYSTLSKIEVGTLSGDADTWFKLKQILLQEKLAAERIQEELDNNKKCKVFYRIDELNNLVPVEYTFDLQEIYNEYETMTLSLQDAKKIF